MSWGVTKYIACRNTEVKSHSATSKSVHSHRSKHKLNWNPAKAAFIGDDEANAMCSRKARKTEYDINLVMKKARLAWRINAQAGC